MKLILSFIWNMFVFLWTSWFMFFLVLWYGKLPKVSYYHLYKPGKLTIPEGKEMFDINYQSKSFPYYKKPNEIVNIICEDERLRSLSFRIINKKGEEIGEQGIRSVIEDILKENNINIY